MNMQTLGLVGGISWVSTIEYYRLINQGINEKLGGLNYSKCIIYSLNYAEVKRNNDHHDLEGNYRLVHEACLHLKTSGAAAIILCANTMHLFADRLENEIQLPLIHIAEATATEIKNAKLQKVGLLGTKLTMELDFFRSRLTEQGIDSSIPDTADRDFIHHTIFEELGRGIIREGTKQQYIQIINKLIADGAQGIILGCTEIPLLIQQMDISVPVFDTTAIHAKAAVDFSLS